MFPRQVAVRARLDQLEALIADISNNPAAHAAFGDRLIREYIARERRETEEELDESADVLKGVP